MLTIYLTIALNCATIRKILKIIHNITDVQCNLFEGFCSIEMSVYKGGKTMAPVRKRTKAPATAPVAKAEAKKAEEKKVETVVKAAEEVKVVETKPAEEKTAKKAPAKKTETKTAAKKTEEKKETKTAAKKTEEKKETKTASKKGLESAFVLQFQGREVTTAQLEERFKEIWTKDLDRKYTEVKKVAFYVKPEESAVYFVVNDSEPGSFGI